MPKVAIIGAAPDTLVAGFREEGWTIATFRAGEGVVPDTVAGAELVVEAGPDQLAYKQKMIQLIQANVPPGVRVLVVSALGVEALRGCAIRPDDISRIESDSLTLEAAKPEDGF